MSCQRVLRLGNRLTPPLLVFIVLLSLLFPLACSQPVGADDPWTGGHIMNEVLSRHGMPPCVYEEQTMILEDKAGYRDVSKIRRFSRVENDGTVKALIVFDNPAEVRGVALLAIRHDSGRGEWKVYLPAFGKEVKSLAERAGGSRFFGTDFAHEDLMAEVISDFHYVRVADQKMDRAAHYVVEAFPGSEEVAKNTGYSLRRHFIRQDNFFIVRTDYYDHRGQFVKRQTFHDLKKLDGDSWRANMITMENHREKHKTLIKINRRIFSQDYVRPEMFTTAWLLDNRHIRTEGKSLLREPSQY